MDETLAVLFDLMLHSSNERDRQIYQQCYKTLLKVRNGLDANEHVNTYRATQIRDQGMVYDEEFKAMLRLHAS